MLQFCWKSRIRVAAMGGALGLAALACGPDIATAQDDANDNFITRMERQLWGGITRGLGLRGPDDPVVEYRERSPLVVPPTRDLPPPQASTTATNPAWPVDPDVKRAKERADAKKKSTAGGFRDADTLGNPMSPSELNAPGASAARTGGGGNTFDPRDGRSMTPTELGGGNLFTRFGLGFGQNRDEVATFTGEPPRGNLTEPPPGYQTPSPAYPYGTTKRYEQLKTQPADPSVGY